ncbi:MAG TPA: hypothetical protein VLA79_07570 [Polyangia bacterium]|nr:hypothetical protein [Polyangia bacterium]
MKHSLSLKLFSSLTVAALVGFLLAVFTAQHGCASSCASTCPATTVYIGSSDNAELPIAFDVNGPACPSISSVICTGDESTTACTHTTITGQAVGRCDVLVVFDPYTDMRPSEIIELQFGATYSAPGTCCKGYPVLGPSTYIIPDHPGGGGIYGTVDGGNREYDAIFIVHDASADAVDASAGARDAGADSLPGG